MLEAFHIAVVRDAFLQQWLPLSVGCKQIFSKKAGNNCMDQLPTLTVAGNLLPSKACTRVTLAACWSSTGSSRARRSLDCGREMRKAEMELSARALALALHLQEHLVPLPIAEIGPEQRRGAVPAHSMNE